MWGMRQCQEIDGGNGMHNNDPSSDFVELGVAHLGTSPGHGHMCQVDRRHEVRSPRARTTSGGDGRGGRMRRPSLAETMSIETHSQHFHDGAERWKSRAQKTNNRSD